MDDTTDDAQTTEDLLDDMEEGEERRVNGVKYRKSDGQLIKDGDDESHDKKVQKNLNISKRHASALKSESVERWGSSYHQNKIVESMISMYLMDDGDGNEVPTMLREIHDAVVGDGGTTSTTSTSTSDDDVMEILDAAESGELDLDEHDLSALKGHSVDWQTVGKALMQTDAVDDVVTRREITEILQREASYGYNSALDKSHIIVGGLVQYPDVDDNLDQMKVTTREVRSSTKPSPESYRDAYCGSLADYTGVSIDTDRYAADIDALAQQVVDDLRMMLTARRQTDSDAREKRIKNAVKMYIVALEQTELGQTVVDDNKTLYGTILGVNDDLD